MSETNIADLPKDLVQALFVEMDQPTLLSARRVCTCWLANANIVLLRRGESDPFLARTVVRLRLFSSVRSMSLIQVPGEVTKLGTLDNQTLYSLHREENYGPASLWIHPFGADSVLVEEGVLDVVVAQSGAGSFLIGLSSNTFFIHRPAPSAIGVEEVQRLPHPQMWTARLSVDDPAETKRLFIRGFRPDLDYAVVMAVDLLTGIRRTWRVLSDPPATSPSCKLRVGGEACLAEFQIDGSGPKGIALHNLVQSHSRWISPVRAANTYCTLKPVNERQFISCDLRGAIHLWDTGEVNRPPLQLLDPAHAGDLFASRHLATGLSPGGYRWIARVQPGAGIEVHTFGREGAAGEKSQVKKRRRNHESLQDV